LTQRLTREELLHWREKIERDDPAEREECAAWIARNAEALFRGADDLIELNSAIAWLSSSGADLPKPTTLDPVANVIEYAESLGWKRPS